MRQLYSKDCKSLDEVMSFINENIDKFDLQRTIVNQLLLLSEETMCLVMEQATPEQIKTSMFNRFGEASIRFSFRGELPFDITNADECKNYEEVELTGMILSYYSDRIKVQYKNGFTTITILIRENVQRVTTQSLIAVLIAIIFTLFLKKGLTVDSFEFFRNNILWPIAEIFLSAIALVATPLLFIYIVSNIATYSSVADKYPGVRKVELRYFVTSIVSILFGMGFFYLIRPLFAGAGWQINSRIDPTMETVNAFFVGVADMVPDNIFEPLLNDRPLQLFFLAVLTGIAVGAVERETGKILSVVNIIKNLFCKMVTVIFHFTPFIIFIFVLTITSFEGLEMVTYEILLILLIFVALGVMFAGYSLQLYFNGVNPLKFWEKMRVCIKEVFHIGNSADAVPTTIKYCERVLKLPRKPLEVSIPLGVAINMDAVCVVQTILVLSLMDTSGISITLQKLAVIFLLVFCLSIGSPNQQGAMTVAVMLMLPAVGLHSSVAATVLLVEIVVGRTMSLIDVVGDIVVTRVTAEKERRIVGTAPFEER